MFNNQGHTTHPNTNDQPTPFVAFLFNKKMQKKQRSQSSEVVQQILFNPNSNNQVLPHHKKIFTISYEDAKRLNTETKIRQKMEEYHQQFNKSQEKALPSQEDHRRRRYRIKTMTSVQQTEKVPPVLMKIMKQTLKHSTYNIWPDPEPELQEAYGLNIQQAKTYKILNKREKLKVKHSLFEPSKEDSIELVETKNNSPARGGGFNVRRKRMTLSNEDNKQFLNNIFFKKSSLPKKAVLGRHSKAKKQNISLHDLKLARMIDCLDLILNSYHLSLQKSKGPQGHHRQVGEKFTYFIGKGNNAQLLRTIFKKRSWWAETNTPLKAHLVWSQLKISKVIRDQHSLTGDCPQPALLEYQKEVKMQSSSNLLKTYSKMLYESRENSSAEQINEQAYSFLFHKEQSKMYYSPLRESEQNIRLRKISEPLLYHNHFESNFQIGNKNALFFNLNRYCHHTKQDLWQIVPLTYYLQASDEATLRQFEQKFSECQDSLWILKPGENSNRGQRITLARSMEEVRGRLGVEQKLIAQSYVKNLLLYNGRKFDLRTYLLGVNMNGRLKFYFYEEGYIKTSSFPYSLKNINDKYVHLTNDAIQQSSDQYGKYEEGNKLSYSEFQRYLDNKYAKEGYSIFDLHKTMRNYAIEVVKSSYHRLNPNRKAFCFELFGLDFLIDSQFKPYLLEVNTNPCLELCSHSLERLIPRMLQNLFRISVDPLFRPQFINNTKSQSYYFYDESFLEKNQFRLIFDERYDADAEWERCSLSEEMLKEESWGEEEEGQ